ncbi:MAG: PEP-CTERM sorting domain-containing protein, partial [Microcoleus sp. SIO2G3]|nr:PEP-CTERM sorting domain-containing protein [Microcoleus sp. SIO2G3]
PNVTGAAYTNSFAGATTTTLYDIDYIGDALYTQNPPNNGTLGNGLPLNIGRNTTIDSRGGFEIITVNGQNLAFAALTPTNSDGSVLYQIDLASGSATSIGNIGGIGGELSGLTAEPVPEPITVLGSLTGGGILALLRRRYRRFKSMS